MGRSTLTISMILEYLFFSIEDFPKVYSKIQVNSVYAKHYIAGHRMIHQYVIVMHHFLALADAESKPSQFFNSPVSHTGLH